MHQSIAHPSSYELPPLPIDKGEVIQDVASLPSCPKCKLLQSNLMDMQRKLMKSTVTTARTDEEKRKLEHEIERLKRSKPQPADSIIVPLTLWICEKCKMAQSNLMNLDSKLNKITAEKDEEIARRKEEIETMKMNDCAQEIQRPNPVQNIQTTIRTQTELDLDFLSTALNQAIEKANFNVAAAGSPEHYISASADWISELTTRCNELTTKVAQLEGENLR